MTTRCLRILSLILLLASSTQTARAQPDWTRFDEAIAQGEAIAIAALTKPVNLRKSKVAQLRIEQVLKGTLKPGKSALVVPGGFNHRVDINKIGEFVAFIDHGNVWRFVGFPVSGKPIDSDILSIWGFSHDGNAHIVAPGWVTLAQLKTYLQNKTLRYAFRGDVNFPRSGKPGWQESGLQLSGTYDPIADAAAKAFASAFSLPLPNFPRVKGFPALAVFPAQPQVDVDNLDGPCLNLEYSNDRELQFRGNVVGIDRNSGEFLIKFAIWRPTLLTPDDLKRYLGNSRPAPPSYTFHLKCAQSGRTKARELTLVMGKHEGTIGQIYGWADRPLEIAEGEFGTNSNGSSAGCLMIPLPDVIRRVLFSRDWVLRMVAPTHTGEFLFLAFELGEPPPEEFDLGNGCETKLLYGVWRGRTRGTLQIHDGKTLKTIAPFSVTVDRVEFDSKAR